MPIWYKKAEELAKTAVIRNNILWIKTKDSLVIYVPYSLRHELMTSAREAMVVKELEALSIANFRLQFRVALTSYYKGILKVPGAGGVQATVPMKRKLVSVPDDPAADGNGNIDAAAGAAAPPAVPPAAPAAPAGAEAGAEAPEEAPAKRGKGGGTKQK